MGTQSPSIRSSASAVIASIESALKDLRLIVGEAHALPCSEQASVDDILPRILLEPGTAEELAVFRLHPLPRETHLVSFSTNDLEAANRLLLSILDSTLVPTGLQLRAANSSRPEIDVRFEGTAAGCEEQRTQTLRLTAHATEVRKDETVWNARGRLWDGNEPGVIGKFSLLPSDLAAFLNQLSQISERLHLTWQAVAQGVGVGLLRFEGRDCSALITAIQEMRGYLERNAGSFTVLRCPAEVKSKIDVWGSAGDALQLMRNIKAQFDPLGTLNPGRFIGGI